MNRKERIGEKRRRRDERRKEIRGINRWNGITKWVKRHRERVR